MVLISLKDGPMRLSVIMPVYNEKDTIREIIAKVMNEETDKERSSWTIAPPTAPRRS